MAHKHRPGIAEIPRQSFGEVNRAMLPAGTTDGDSHVVSVVAHHVRQPAPQETAHIPEQPADCLLLFQKCDHGRVATREAPQFRLIVGRGEHPRVAYPVRVARHTVLASAAPLP